MTKQIGSRWQYVYPSAFKGPAACIAHQGHEVEIVAPLGAGEGEMLYAIKAGDGWEDLAFESWLKPAK